MQTTTCDTSVDTRATDVQARTNLHASKLRIRCRWLRRGAISRPDDKYQK
ncbi:hypothetical protein [Pseudomonas sp.]|jgi:hypothetical protein|nr:hypothetical protein [Pseudomonas sp.]